MLNIDTGSLVAIMGDTHSDGRATIAGLKFARAHGCTNVLHVGDFGGWNDRPGQKYVTAVDRQLKLYDMEMDVNYGNHDDYSILSDIGDADFKALTDRIRIFNRPALFTLNGTTRAVSLSGAASLDHGDRRPNIDWWAEEAITYGDLYRLAAMVEEHDWTGADLMITHEAPGLGEHLNAVIAANRKRFGPITEESERYTAESQAAGRRAVDTVMPKHLFHGHYHTRYDDIYGPTQVHGLHMNGHNGHTVIFDLDRQVVVAESTVR